MHVISIFFCKMWNGRKEKKRSFCNEIRMSDRTIRTPKEIADEFAKFDCAISHSHDKRYETYGDIHDSTENRILNGEFTFEEISSAIKTMKLGKAPDIDNLQNEHLKYAGQQ